MSTPTIGELRRRIERLEQEQRQETPEMVSDDGEIHEAVDSIDLVSMSIEEFAERKVRIADLEREIEDLKARAEEWDEEIGMVDGESKDERPEIAIGTRSGEPAYTIGGYEAQEVGHYRNTTIYKDEVGNYWLEHLSRGTINTDELRELADKIEEIGR